ncbi:MAG: D-2-hydroxyacid dehydrogenase [Parachlamydiales bacterium]|nr:D-2-hydroxyacid dehydrogenase [Parachlamydiales bacterium]
MKPKIVILDGHLMNPGDFSWEPYQSIGHCTIYERTPEALVVERSKEADIVLINKVVFSKAVIEKLPKLKYIGVTATGYNNVDVQAAKLRNVIVTNVPAYSTASVVQHTFSLLFELTNQVGLHNAAVHAGAWEKSPDFSFWKTPLIELQNKTMGIIGYGEIGQGVAKVAALLGMKIIVHTRTQKDPDIKYVDQKTLFEKSDVVSLHLPYSDQHVINEETLSWMKPTAILINASRGKLVDEKALAKALKEKRIYGAAIDVLDQEPPNSNCPLLRMENCIITPHIAWASFDARKRLFSIVLENIQAFLDKSPKNIV